MRIRSLLLASLFPFTACDSDSGPSDQPDSSDSSDSTNPTDVPIEPEEVTPIPAVAAGFPDFGPLGNQAMLDGIEGTYDVVIFRVPAGKEAQIGRASLTVGVSGQDVTLTLAKGAETIAEVTGAVGDKVQIQPFLNFLIVDQWGLDIPRVTATFRTSGVIEGEAGMDSSYAFRNAIVHWGSNPPSVLATLAGSWSGEHQAAMCRAPVTLAIAADSVAITGVAQPGCGGEETVTATWDGNDDYVIPNAWLPDTQTTLSIDVGRGGGSQLQGGVRLELLGTTLLEAYTNLAGAAGNITVKNPTKH